MGLFFIGQTSVVITHDYIFYVLILDKQANVIKLLIQNQKKVKSFDILT